MFRITHEENHLNRKLRVVGLPPMNWLEIREYEIPTITEVKEEANTEKRKEMENTRKEFSKILGDLMCAYRSDIERMIKNHLWVRGLKNVDVDEVVSYITELMFRYPNYFSNLQYFGNAVLRQVENAVRKEVRRSKKQRMQSFEAMTGNAYEEKELVEHYSQDELTCHGFTKSQRPDDTRELKYDMSDLTKVFSGKDEKQQKLLIQVFQLWHYENMSMKAIDEKIGQRCDRILKEVKSQLKTFLTNAMNPSFKVNPIVKTRKIQIVGYRAKLRYRAVIAK